MVEQRRFRVFRGTRQQGELKEYQVAAGEGMVVRDDIHAIQAEQAPDLAVRWNCKAGKCGSCSAEINGKPRLLCMTRMSDYPADETITVTPMKAFPVIKDLVTDVSWNYEVNKRIPAFQPRAPDAPAGTWRMYQYEFERPQEFRKCIECFLCQDVCHVLRAHGKHAEFMGPALFVRAAGYELHPHDLARHPRRPQEHHRRADRGVHRDVRAGTPGRLRPDGRARPAGRGERHPGRQLRRVRSGGPGVGHRSAVLRDGGRPRVSARASAPAATVPAKPALAAPGTTVAAASAATTRPTVVIVGAGFGGLRAARSLRDAPVDVVLVDRHNYHLFQPLLYQVATAGLEPEQIARPVRAVLRRQRNFEFRMTEVTGLDADGKRLVTTDGPIAYDYLILAAGGETNYFGLEGVVRHGFGLKDIPEAIRIRNHVLHAFERAMLESDAERRRAWLTFVVVGGGPTGVEMAGALSELIRLVLVKDYPRLNVKDVRVLLLEATDRLLGPMPARLREAAAETLSRNTHRA